MGVIWEQYRRRNNLETTEIPDDVNDKNLGEKVIQVLSEIQFIVSSSDIQARHPIGKTRNSSEKKTIVRFISRNRKHAKKEYLINLC